MIVLHILDIEFQKHKIKVTLSNGYQVHIGEQKVITIVDEKCLISLLPLYLLDPLFPENFILKDLPHRNIMIITDITLNFIGYSLYGSMV